MPLFPVQKDRSTVWLPEIVMALASLLIAVRLLGTQIFEYRALELLEQ